MEYVVYLLYSPYFTTHTTSDSLLRESLPTMDPLLAVAADVPGEQPTPPPPAAPPNFTGKLWAIADLHLSYKANRYAWEKLQPKPDDGLILVGDVGESAEHLRIAFTQATACFKRVWFTVGNHARYTLPTQERQGGAKGEAKYMECINVAREFGILTPEDDYVLWDGEGGPCLIAPIFTLYDYSFRPPHVSLDQALDWAKEEVSSPVNFQDGFARQETKADLAHTHDHVGNRSHGRTSASSRPI